MFLVAFITGILSTGLYYSTDKDKDKQNEMVDKKELLMNIQPKYKIICDCNYDPYFAKLFSSNKQNVQLSINKTAPLVTTIDNTRQQCPF